MSLVRQSFLKLHLEINRWQYLCNNVYNVGEVDFCNLALVLASSDYNKANNIFVTAFFSFCLRFSLSIDNVSLFLHCVYHCNCNRYIVHQRYRQAQLGLGFDFRLEPIFATPTDASKIPTYTSNVVKSGPKIIISLLLPMDKSKYLMYPVLFLGYTLSEKTEFKLSLIPKREVLSRLSWFNSFSKNAAATIYDVFNLKKKSFLSNETISNENNHLQFLTLQAFIHVSLWDIKMR